ncbi:hypothetical protein [Aurantiacibacter aquimixticola]|uniref:Porin n=1 Tax=Aurantiacibacter aquimixticola TaxID=1958945 RepID=A0A419RUP9_9SPHN|nr:hypothetical protein [Aurantiacibacter aquimixticola]RJY09474.1 hypothetical protein D6201_08985 [Aurantiacibacter aquimixticola]
MSKKGNIAVRKAALAASAVLCAVALPSSAIAIGLLESDSSQLRNQFAFTPASADPDIAELVAETTKGQARMMRFTPAAAAVPGAERAVTVAVRVDAQTAQALASSTNIAAGRSDASSSTSLNVTPTRYNLGLARGFGNFTQSSTRPGARSAALSPTRSSPQLSRSLSDANIPDLSTFAPRSRAREEDSRFAARVEMDERRSVAARDNRGAVSDQMVDVQGSYRLTNNLDITAGVRYEQDRDIVPLPEVDQQDSQAVYVGTQFRF